jgi:hypothetical protein
MPQAEHFIGLLLQRATQSFGLAAELDKTLPVPCEVRPADLSAPNVDPIHTLTPIGRS